MPIAKQRAEDPFIALSDGLAWAFRARRRAPMPPRQALETLRKGRVSDRKRLVLTQDVMRGADVSSFDKETILSLGLQALQRRPGLAPSARAALVAVGLRIANSERAGQTEWFTELVAVSVRLRESGVVPDWRGAFGMTEDEVVGCCERIRKIRRYPDYVDPTSLRVAPVSEAPDLPVGVSSGLKVSRVEFDGFRATPGSVKLDLTVNNKPSSVIIFGDNGVGKSTIVNAIELACQGTVGRLAPALSNSGLTLINLSNPRQQASVSVTLTNGDRLERNIEQIDDRWQVSGSETPFAFSLSPLALQRADLVRFLSTPGSRRGQLFVGHFAADGTDEYSRSVLERARTAKKARQQFVQDLAGRAGHPPRVGIEYVLKMLRAIHLGGIAEAEWRVTRPHLPKEYVDQQNRYRELNREVSKSREAARRLPETELQSHALQVKRLGELLGDIDPPLTEALITVTGYSFIKRLEVTVGGAGALALQFRVHLHNGTTVTPEQIFSEGVQDLLAILFFLEVAKAAALRGQAKVLILDDVIQSVDATIRRRLLQHIASDLKNWQLIITCHDRLWRDHVQEALHKQGIQHCEVTIRSWDFAEGPIITTSRSDPSTDLRRLVRQASPRSVAGAAGLLLETVCDRLSWTLPATVTRTKGDRYTLGELWDSVTKKARNSPELGGQFAEIDRVVSLRNQLGAHYNAIADSIADAEADRFGELVLALWESVYCDDCKDYIAKLQSKTYACRCGKVRFTT